MLGCRAAWGPRAEGMVPLALGVIRQLCLAPAPPAGSSNASLDLLQKAQVCQGPVGHVGALSSQVLRGAHALDFFSHTSCPSRPARTQDLLLNSRWGSSNSSSRISCSSNGMSTWGACFVDRGVGEAKSASLRLQPRLSSIAMSHTKRKLSGIAPLNQGDDALSSQGVATLSSVKRTAQIINDGLDPMATEAFVDSLTDQRAVEVLDLILKRRGKSAPSDEDVFVTGDARIRIEDYDKLDTNKDGYVSREELEKYIISQKAPFTEPTRDQLTMLAISAAVPFIGFGFMDNALMIIFGEAIETHIGAMMTVSTMACAAIGNLISDVFGVGMGSYVEAVARKLGFKEPALTEEQQELSSCKVASNMGAALGVALGCFLGMFPLLLVEHQVKKRPEQELAET